MRLHLYVATVLLGVVLAVHLAMNGKVGNTLNNARVGNALFWCIGAVGALAIGLTGWQKDALSPLRDVHPALFTAGIMGACLVFAIAWLIPQVGAKNEANPTGDWNFLWVVEPPLFERGDKPDQWVAAHLRNASTLWGLETPALNSSMMSATSTTAAVSPCFWRSAARRRAGAMRSAVVTIRYAAPRPFDRRDEGCPARIHAGASHPAAVVATYCASGV